MLTEVLKGLQEEIYEMRRERPSVAEIIKKEYNDI